MKKTYLLNKRVAEMEGFDDLKSYIVDESSNSFYLSANAETDERHNENFVRYLLTEKELGVYAIAPADVVSTHSGLYAVRADELNKDITNR